MFLNDTSRNFRGYFFHVIYELAFFGWISKSKTLLAAYTNESLPFFCTGHMSDNKHSIPIPFDPLDEANNSRPCLLAMVLRTIDLRWFDMSLHLCSYVNTLSNLKVCLSHLLVMKD